MMIEQWLVAHGCKDAVMRMLGRFRRGREWGEDIFGLALIRYGERGGDIQDRRSVMGWMKTTALRIAINDIRRKVDIPLTVSEIENTAETLLIDHQERERLLTAVNDLPARQRMAVMLRIVDEKSFKEIAELMDCEYDTAKANYRWGSQTLKERMSG